MKIIVVLFTMSFLFTIDLSAQQESSDLEQWTQIYQLDTEQQKVVKQLLDQKAVNLLALKAIEIGDPKVYQEKQLVLEKQTRMGLRSILDDRQLLIYKAEEEKRKTAIKAKVARLKADGADKEEIATAVKALKY